MERRSHVHLCHAVSAGYLFARLDESPCTDWKSGKEMSRERDEDGMEFLYKLYEIDMNGRLCVNGHKGGRYCETKNVIGYIIDCPCDFVAINRLFRTRILQACIPAETSLPKRRNAWNALWLYGERLHVDALTVDFSNRRGCFRCDGGYAGGKA